MTDNDTPNENDPVEQPEHGDDATDAQSTGTDAEDTPDVDTGEDAEQAESDAESTADVAADDNADEQSDAAEPVDDSVPALYDFHHPQHRLGNPIPQFKIAGRKIAGMVAASVDTDLHVAAKIELASVCYRKHTDFIKELDIGVSVFKNEISPLSQDMLIIFERGLILSMVASFFGGTVSSQPDSQRALSQTETRFATRLRSAIINAVESVCAECFKIRHQHTTIVTAEELVSMGGSETRVLAVQEYQVTAGEQKESFYITYPWSAVASMSSLSTDELPDAAIASRRWSNKLTEHVRACAVELQGKLAETEVTVSQLLDMQKGDFIPLGDVGPATFTVDNTPIFDASIGASNGFVSASILQWSIEGDSRNE
ncbi:MAG: FliM/FliN family flagellar motor switch protein [Pseudomonadota bacterium]